MVDKKFLIKMCVCVRERERERERDREFCRFERGEEREIFCEMEENE